MKIVAISDLHGDLPNSLPEGELLLIAGDTVPLRMQSNFEQSRKWWLNDFCNWLKTLKFERIILIGGNHDGFLETHGQEIKATLIINKCIYLCNEQYTYLSYDGKTYTFFGTPYCKQFGNWWFMYSQDKLEELYKDIPKDLDILLSHDAPYGVSDICYQNTPWNDGSHIGNKALRDAILDKAPAYCIHGHLHSSNHDEEILGTTKVYNVSLKDERYIMTYKPLTLDI